MTDMCDNCGTPADDEQIFCTSCGEMIVRDTAPAVAPSHPARSSALPAPPAPPAPVAPPTPTSVPGTPIPAPPVPPRATAPPTTRPTRTKPAASTPAAAPVGVGFAPVPQSGPPPTPPPLVGVPSGWTGGRGGLPEVKPLTVVATLLVVIGVLGVLIAVGQVNGGSSDVDTAGSGFETEPAAVESDVSDVSGGSSGSSGSSSSSGGSGSESSSGSSSPSPTTPPPSTAAPITEATVGRWILVLESVPKSQSLTAARGLRGQVDGGDPRVTVIDSDATPGMNPGYWVVAVLDFGSREAAVADCISFGREIGGRCYPTRVGDGAR